MQSVPVAGGCIRKVRKACLCKRKNRIIVMVV